ncbi:unnamed protein product [Linum tenue]|uniref:F-box protein At3g26010-like beta-propeller domain-containing protein n=1 Tax=Linum tenue TaxID=586396 RepID=A0AAV0QLN5_9ROSI|nr:unnamed protein product [Linum tenue]
MSKLDDDDLLLEILIRLPDPGTALRCKPVCKRWSSLISSPYFNRRFISHHQSKNAEGPPGEPSSLLSFIPLPNEEIRRRSIIFDCFKDLLLCGFTERGDYNGELARLYLVCNWFTKQWIALPLAPERTESPLGFVARLVCEPCRNSNHTLELGDGQVFVYSAEYRFRVVYAYQEMRAAVTKLDVFCSESGKWTKEALVLDGYGKNLRQNMISLNGKLWWSYLKQGETGIVAVNPFCPHITPIINNASGVLVASSKCNIAVSQGALYILVLEENEISPDVNVWSLEKDGKSWGIQYKVFLNSSRFKDLQVSECYICDLHPEKPEIVFLELFNLVHHLGIFTFNLTSGELEFAFDRLYIPHFMVLHIQPKVSYWPTPIPRYEELQGIYDGSYNCLVQSREATIVGNYFCFSDFTTLVRNSSLPLYLF